MKRLLSLFAALLLGLSLAAQPLLEKLQQVEGVSDITVIKQRTPIYSEYYAFFFEQPVDHKDPQKGTFRQRVYIGHRDFNAPVVIELEGYHGRPGSSELSQLFSTNYINIEHRFFGQSVPEGGIPWPSLTLENAANDHHRFIQAMRKSVYPDVKWISTGISKGGQTTIAHRYFFPEDVEISVPYVGPWNLDAVDPRLEKFFDKVGNVPDHSGLITKTNRTIKWRIIDFQKRCFELLYELVPRIGKYAEDRHFTFNMVGGNERATKLTILEFPFAFWQWGCNIDEMPLVGGEDEDIDAIFDYLMKVGAPDFFNDASIISIQPFYYAAMTELGTYDYNIKPFKKFFPEEKGKRITFSFALPDGYKDVPFTGKKLLNDANKWMQTDAERMLFIYGGDDPWGSTAVDLKKNDKCYKFVKAGASHSVRIRDFEALTKEEIIGIINGWLSE